MTSVPPGEAVEPPPDEAFEPQPGEAIGESAFRRRLRIAVTLTVVAALVVLAAVEGGGYIIRRDTVESTPVPTPPIHAAARLAVVDAAGELSTIDEGGGSVLAYPAPGVALQFPAWSPDGSHIAAIGQGPEGSGVYIFAVPVAMEAPGAPVVIYRSADRRPFYLYWTPDSRHLTFLTTEPDGLALRIAPADGSTAAVTIRAGAPIYWDFVDPGRLLIHSGPGGPDGFFGEVAPNGAPLEPLGAAARPGLFRAPAVSPGGGQRAYTAEGDGAIGEVVLEARDGTSARRIRVFGPAALSFDPGGDSLAFIAPDQPSAQAASLPIGPLRLLVPGSVTPRVLLDRTVVAFIWSPDGKTIATLQLEGPADNVTEATTRGTRAGVGAGVEAGVEAAGAEARTAAAEGAAAATGLPLRLAFVEVASGSIRSERVVRLSDVFVNQVLPFFDQYALSHRFWSPDGMAIVLPVVGDGDGTGDGDVTRLFVIPADGSDARAVADGEMGFWSP